MHPPPYWAKIKMHSTLINLILEQEGVEPGQAQLNLALDFTSIKLINYYHHLQPANEH